MTAKWLLRNTNLSRWTLLESSGGKQKMSINIHHGDCLEVMKTIPDGSVDMTVTSPPYDNLRTYNGNNGQWGEHVWKTVLSSLYKVTRLGGVVVWIVNDATIKGSETGTSFKQALYAKECGFNLHDTMIWSKGESTNPASTRYNQSFEYMFIFSKGKMKTFNPIKDKKNISFGRLANTGTIREPNGTTKKRTQSENIIAEFGQRLNVWEMTGEKSRKNTFHPAVFPLQLATDHIFTWSNPGENVLDCFMGSGTTGIACQNLGRSFIGIELDDNYYKIAESRLGLTSKQRRSYDMKNIELTFTFETTEHAQEFIEFAAQYVGQASTPVAPVPAAIPAAVPTATAVLPTALPVVVPTVASALPVTPVAKPAAKAPGGTTQIEVKNAMRDYKAANGHAAYKELLAYFGAGTVRDIPKSEYTAVVQMATAPSVATALPEVPATQTIDVLPQAPEMDALAPLVTPEQLRHGLSEHKARWGMEATRAVLTRLGFTDPNTIPVEQYTTVLTELTNDDPSASAGGIDLTDF